MNCRFVLAEATRTHSNQPKALVFEQAKSDPEIARLLPRIEHVVVEDLPDSADSWELEHFQRNALVRGLAGAEDDDLVIVSDCDADNVGAALSFLGNMVTVNCSDLLLNDDSILIILLQKLQGEGTGAMLPFYFICAQSPFIFQISFLLFLSGHAQCARSKMSRVQVSRLQHAHRCVQMEQQRGHGLQTNQAHPRHPLWPCPQVPLCTHAAKAQCADHYRTPCSGSR